MPNDLLSSPKKQIMEGIRKSFSVKVKGSSDETFKKIGFSSNQSFKSVLETLMNRLSVKDPLIFYEENNIFIREFCSDHLNLGESC